MDPIARRAKNYRTAAGKSPFREWLMRRLDVEPRNRINSRIRRIEEFGNYGDCEPVGNGLYELKVDTGPGYRVYFGIDEDKMILLGGGSKDTKFRISERRSSVGRTTMPKRVTDFREDLLADLSDPNEAACYLNAAFEDSEQMVLVALRDVAEARQMARVAVDAGVAREALYRMLHREGNPTYASLVGILNALGLKMSFAPAEGTNDGISAPMRTRKEISVPICAGISGIVGQNAPILQLTPKAGILRGSVGGISRKPLVVGPWPSYGSVLHGVAAVGESLHA